MRLDEFKSELVSSIEMNLSTINSIKPPHYHGQTSSNIIKYLHLKLPENILMHHNSIKLYLP